MKNEITAAIKKIERDADALKAEIIEARLALSIIRARMGWANSRIERIENAKRKLNYDVTILGKQIKAKK